MAIPPDFGRVFIFSFTALAPWLVFLQKAILYSTPNSIASSRAVITSLGSPAADARNIGLKDYPNLVFTLDIRYISREFVLTF